MQPLNATLVCVITFRVAKEQEVKQLSSPVESALGAAEDLIGDLLDITIKSGKLDQYSCQYGTMLANPNAEFSALATQQKIDFKMIPHLCLLTLTLSCLDSDSELLTNAFTITQKGKLCSNKTVNGQVRIDVG